MVGPVRLALLLLALAGCTTIYNPATERQETLLDTSVEVAIGKIARTQMGLVSLNMGKVPLEQQERVQRIGRKMAAVSDRKDVPYQFGVIKDKSFNAFALPGGTIYVHSGLLDKADDEQLASVLGHEIGHVAARHMAKSLQAQLGYVILIQIASSAGMSADTGQMVQTIYAVFRNGFSRQDEREADRLGIRYLQRAGVDPQAAARMLELMLQESPEDPTDKAMVWQRTHPLTSERLQNTKEEIAKLKAEKPAVFCPACGRSYPSGSKFCEVDSTPLKEKAGP